MPAQVSRDTMWETEPSTHDHLLVRITVPLLAVGCTAFLWMLLVGLGKLEGFLSSAHGSPASLGIGVACVSRKSFRLYHRFHTVIQVTVNAGFKIVLL